MQVAEQEAFEEAGVFGTLERVTAEVYAVAEGSRTTGRKRKSLILYPLHVTATLHDWPEKAQRRRRWMSTLDAVRAICDPELSNCIGRFANASSSSRFPESSAADDFLKED